MRIAVLADIHGNLDALTAVLADADRSGIAHTVSLGDNIGYGPESDAVVRLLTERGIPSVVGNHEIVVQSGRFGMWFNPVVRNQIRKTLEGLSPESIEQIKKYPRFLSLWNCRFVHGFPPKSPFLYLFQMSEAKVIRSFSRIGERLCFVGHTHELQVVEYKEEKPEYRRPEQEIIYLNPGSRYLVNAGSVGQPRDGDPHAKYLIWDREEDSLEIRYVLYDIEAVVKKIINAGYPEYFGTRLWG